MNVLVLNSGSSSLKFQLIATDMDRIKRNADERLLKGEVERIGGDKPTKVDVRVVVATHRDLESLVREGKFRQDLFHRVYVFPIVLPSLRERKEDIPVLVQHFAKQVCAQRRSRTCRRICGRATYANCET